jgi:hypothetical protein
MNGTKFIFMAARLSFTPMEASQFNDFHTLSNSEKVLAVIACFTGFLEVFKVLRIANVEMYLAEFVLWVSQYPQIRTVVTDDGELALQIKIEERDLLVRALRLSRRQMGEVINSYYKGVPEPTGDLRSFTELNDFKRIAVVLAVLREPQTFTQITRLAEIDIRGLPEELLTALERLVSMIPKEVIFGGNDTQSMYVIDEDSKARERILAGVDVESVHRQIAKFEV